MIRSNRCSILSMFFFHTRTIDACLDCMAKIDKKRSILDISIFIDQITAFNSHFDTNIQNLHGCCAQTSFDVANGLKFVCLYIAYIHNNGGWESNIWMHNDNGGDDHCQKKCKIFFAAVEVGKINRACEILFCYHCMFYTFLWVKIQ